MRKDFGFIAVVVCALLAVACGPRPAFEPEPDPEPEVVVAAPYQPTDAWDAYRHGLELASLTGTALGRDWMDAGESALAAPVHIELPYEESGFFDPARAQAAGFRFAVRRGQRVQAWLELEDEPAARLFLDVFRLQEEEAPAPIATAPADDRRIVFESRGDGDYVLRVQPELLRGGSFELRIDVGPALAFPVADHGMAAVWSAFGVPREGGRRTHHGVDIFAPRGTPVLATSRARVREVEERGLGGKVIWLRDHERDLYLYYAHLDTQEVEKGAWVEAGQVIGRVGNTGNARTTPPHLHFGIYPRGERPIDPDPFLRPGRAGTRAPAAAGF